MQIQWIVWVAVSSNWKDLLYFNFESDASAPGKRDWVHLVSGHGNFPPIFCNFQWKFTVFFINLIQTPSKSGFTFFSSEPVAASADIGRPYDCQFNLNKLCWIVRAIDKFNKLIKSSCNCFLSFLQAFELEIHASIECTFSNQNQTAVSCFVVFKLVLISVVQYLLLSDIFFFGMLCVAKPF